MTSSTLPGMSDDERMVYAEAGQWVRLSNTVAWTMAAFLLSVLQAPILLAMTTAINRWLLFVVSVVVVLFWLYFESLYQRGADRARLLLLKLEQRADFVAPKLYSEQHVIVPKGWRQRSPRLMDLLWLYALLLTAVWLWLLFFAAPYAPSVAAPPATTVQPAAPQIIVQPAPVPQIVVQPAPVTVQPPAITVQPAPVTVQPPAIVVQPAPVQPTIVVQPAPVTTQRSEAAPDPKPSAGPSPKPSAEPVHPQKAPRAKRVRRSERAPSFGFDTRKPHQQFPGEADFPRKGPSFRHI